MRFICLGYLDEAEWNKKSEQQQSEFVERCFAYDDVLRDGGHFAGGDALQSYTNAVTLRPAAGKVNIVNGPYAETKEQIGGILYLEARDLNQAITLMSKHPGVEIGPFEIRPIDEAFTKIVEERSQNHAHNKKAWSAA
jgi:hypothetical protein